MRTLGDGPLVCRECTKKTLAFMFETSEANAGLAVAGVELLRDGIAAWKKTRKPKR